MVLDAFYASYYRPNDELAFRGQIHTVLRRTEIGLYHNITYTSRKVNTFKEVTFTGTIFTHPATMRTMPYIELIREEYLLDENTNSSDRVLEFIIRHFPGLPQMIEIDYLSTDASLSGILNLIPIPRKEFTPSVLYSQYYGIPEDCLQNTITFDNAYEVLGPYILFAKDSFCAILLSQQVLMQELKNQPETPQ